MNEFYFVNAEQAVAWTTEILRKRRFPKISSIYREMILQTQTEEERTQLRQWFGETGNLPKTPEDRISLALEVQKLVECLPDDQKQVLKLKYWGDYFSDNHLTKALRLQDAMRQKGMRARLSYRYSHIQIGRLINTDRKTVGRRVDKALEGLENKLGHKGLVLKKETPPPCNKEEKYA